jgi:hypothetical protein
MDAGIVGITVRVYEEFCTRRVLVSEWMVFIRRPMTTTTTTTSVVPTRVAKCFKNS